MPTRKEPLDLGRSLIEAFLTHERIHQVLLELIDPSIWVVAPPGPERQLRLWEWDRRWKEVVSA